MNIEIINTGTELLLGRILNTHQQWLCAQLDQLGYTVTRQVAIDDNASDIVEATRQSLHNASIVILTGGLGPTSDDLTRSLIAQLLGRRLLVDTTTLERIQHYFSSRHRTIPFHCEIQAQYPEGAQIIPNDFGTAPGLAIELEQNPFSTPPSKALLILLPGPPRELRPMFSKYVPAILKRTFPLSEEYASRTLRTACTGESTIEQIVAPKLAHLTEQHLEIGYCARVGEVELRFIAHGKNAHKIVDEAEKIARKELGSIIYGVEEDKLEETVVHLLTQKKKTVGTVESCTGGFIAHRITNIPGASAVFMGSCVTYSNASKINLVGVNEKTLQQHGAVSAEVACQMADGLRQRLNVDYSISATGIAGPDGGTPEKPVGTVFIGLASAQKTEAQKFFCPYDRENFKIAVSQFALDWIRKTLNEE